MSTSPTAGNLTAHAIRVGITRGWIEFRNSLRSPQDIGFYVFFGGAALAYLLFNRDNIIEGTDIALATVTLPSIIGALVILAGLLLVDIGGVRRVNQFDSVIEKLIAFFIALWD
jgi:hypothetical protein